jgi:hypothetical protein
MPTSAYRLRQPGVVAAHRCVRAAPRQLPDDIMMQPAKGRLCRLL